MAGAGKKTWTAGDVLTASDVNTYLMDQAVMNFAGTAARSSAIPSPSEGMVSHVGGGTVQVYDGADWVDLGGGIGAAVVSSPAATGNYTDGDGQEWNYYAITATGTVTFSAAGQIDLLVVGGGGGGWGGSPGPGGGGGGMRWGTFEVDATSYTFTIGAGGSPGNDGNTTDAGAIVKIGGGAQGRRQSSYNLPGYGGGGSGGGEVDYAGTQNGGGAGGTVYGSNNYDGITIDYDNTATERGIGGYTTASGAANTGNGGGINGAYSGGSGVIIFRVKV